MRLYAHDDGYGDRTTGRDARCHQRNRHLAVNMLFADVVARGDTRDEVSFKVARPLLRQSAQTALTNRRPT